MVKRLAVLLGLVVCTGIEGVSAQTAVPVLVTPPPPPHALHGSAFGGIMGGVHLGAFTMTAVKGQPYALSLKTTHTRTGSDGTPQTTVREEHKWRDASGRERDETVSPLGNWPTVRDPIAQTIAHLSASTKTAEVTHVPLPKPPTPEQEAQSAKFRASAEEYRRTHPPSPDVEGELPPRTIAGVYATGKRRILTLRQTKDGVTQEVRVTEETWRSPELQITLESTTDDPRPAMGKIVTVVTDLKRVDPDPALFQIPADYKVTDSK